MAEVDTGQGGTSAAALARRYPKLARLLFLLVPLGLAGVFVWLRLGDGRLARFEFGCALLAVASALATVLGLLGGLRLRYVGSPWSRWCGYGFGCGFASLLMVSLYLVAQGVCWRLNEKQVNRFVRTGDHSTGAVYQSNRVLGYMPRPNSTADARFEVDGKAVFAYTYQTDEYRRRVVPSQQDDGTGQEKALLFFGGSYTFGEGVNDEAALPNQLALRAPNVTMYNYAFSGYGPNQMLARLESMDTRIEVPEPEVAAVYVFIPNHVRRVIGAFSVTPWARHAPYYVLGEGGTPIRLGSFQGDRPRLTGWYDFLQGDQVLKRFQIDFPVRLRADHFELTAAVIARAAALFEEQFRSSDFYVVLYPASPQDEFDSRVMGARLEARGLLVLDLSDLLPPPLGDHFFLPHDSHPRPQTHAAVAEALAARLPFLGAEKSAK